MIRSPLDTVRGIQATLEKWQDFKLRIGHWPVRSMALAGFLNVSFLVAAGFLIWSSIDHHWTKPHFSLVFAGLLVVWVYGGSWLRERVWLTELRDPMTPGVWEITRNKDGTFDILHAGKLICPFVPDRYLYDALKGYGFVLIEQENIEQQLDHSGKAAIVW